MAGKWAVIVAVESYRNPAWAGVPYAESAATAVAKALSAAGIANDRLLVLIGPDATKGVIEARLRQLRKRVRKDDTVLAFVSGRTFVNGNQTYLAAWDTLPDLATDSAVSLHEFVQELRKTRSEAIGLFLDPAGEWVPRELTDVAGIASCSPGESSATAAGLKSGLWTSLVVEALTSDAAVSLDSVHKHVLAGLPKLVGRFAGAGAVQTPVRFGPKTDVPIRASRPAGPPTVVLDPARLARVVFRHETRVKVKDLAGFRKSHTVPVAATPAAKSFVARLAADELRAELDRGAEEIRQHFGYKRKAIDRDGGYIRTPDFELAVSADLDPQDPSVALIRRDLGRLTDPRFVRSPSFAAFGKQFDSLVFEFAEPLDVEAFVDCLEDLPKSVGSLHLSADGRSCEATVTGVPGRIVVDRNSLTVRGRAKDAGGLLDLLLAFLNNVGPVGDPQSTALKRPGEPEQ